MGVASTRGFAGRKVVAWLAALTALLALACSLAVAAPQQALADNPTPVDVTTAKVDFTSQKGGEFLHTPQFGVEVASNEAELFGYTDKVDGVSVLDVLVKAHELKYGADFKKESAENFLVIGEYGSPEKQFTLAPEDGLYYGGFFLNHAMANDGTMYDDLNYNATTVTNQAVADGDLVEFFFYENECYGDCYTWFVDSEGVYSRNLVAAAGEKLQLGLKGFNAMTASQFKDETGLTSCNDASSLYGVQLFTVDLATGDMTPIEGAVTNDDGAVEVSFEKAGEYWITAFGIDEEEDAWQTIMTLTKVTVNDSVIVPEKPITINVTATISDKGELVKGKDGKPVAQVPITLSDKASYIIDDALKAVHDQCFNGGAEAGYASSMTDWGLSIDKLWGDTTMNFGYYVNGKMAWNAEEPITDGDMIDAFIMTTAWEPYAAFEKPAYKATAFKPLEVTLQEGDWSSDELVMVPSEKASVFVYGDNSVSAATTDANGKATLTFKKQGTYLVTASKTQVIDGATYPAIAAPVCVVTVAANPDEANLANAKVTLSKTKYTYANKSFSPTATVTSKSGKLLVKGTDYTVTYKNNKNAGTAKVVVSGKGNYTGTKTVMFTIAKAKCPAKVTTTKKSIRAKKLENRKRVIKGAITVSEAVKGSTIKYKRVTKGSSKQLTKVDPKTGAITVKQNTKAGTYKVKVKVTITKKNYKKFTTEKTVTINVTKN